MKSLIDTIKWEVNKPRADEYLHFSTDLQNPRHTCISWVHGYPMVDRPWMNTFPLLQGTAIHEYVHTIMHDQTDIKYISEQPIFVEHRDFPWKGTADAYLETDDEVWLIDYKTASGVSLSFMNEAKPEHVLQVSAYYHYGIAIPNLRVGILYLPSSPDYKRRWEEPRFYEIQPVSMDEVSQRMQDVEESIITYLDDGETLPAPLIGDNTWKHNKRNKTWELWYKPHYTSMFCPWRGLDNDPCGCSTQTVELMEVVDIDPTPEPAIITENNKENDDDSI